ncbi:MAG: hypothetical protein Q8P31_04275 [Bacillota bacterium]|nr:hypothetical protein [Bacillota bacterium]
MRKEIPLAIAFVTGFVVLLEYFFLPAVPASKAWATMLQQWGIVVSGFAMFVAATNLVLVNVKKMDPKRNKEWYNPVLLLVFMFGMAFIGLFVGERTATYQFLFTKMYQPLGTAMFALMVFFIASAAQRAFRAKSVEAALLLAAGIIVMLGRAPVGELAGSWLPNLTNWIMNFPNVAGNRAIMMGAALGATATAFRALVGIDRSYLGVD